MRISIFGNPDSFFWKKSLKIIIKLNSLLNLTINQRFNQIVYRFKPKTRMEVFRYTTFFSKEKGTLKWLDENIVPSSIMYDIGANVGLYSIYAAKKHGDVKVYAFEPHKVNFATLLENISLNDLEGSIFPLSFALNDAVGFFDLNYNSMESGASMTQLGHTKLPHDRDFKPKMSELVYSLSVDELIATGKVQQPTLIKIDVDGNEISILKGMRGLLTSSLPPKSIQIEINPGERNDVVNFLSTCGYVLDHKHFTKSGQVAFENNKPLDEIPHNAVFVKAG